MKVGNWLNLVYGITNTDRLGGSGEEKEFSKTGKYSHCIGKSEWTDITLSVITYCSFKIGVFPVFVVWFRLLFFSCRQLPASVYSGNASARPRPPYTHMNSTDREKERSEEVKLGFLTGQFLSPVKLCSLDLNEKLD